MTTLIVIVVVLVVVAASVWAAKRVNHPENAASHTDTSGDATSERFYTDPGRPAGPDAEDPVGGAGSAPG